MRIFFIPFEKIDSVPLQSEVVELINEWKIEINEMNEVNGIDWENEWNGTSEEMGRNILMVNGQT